MKLETFASHGALISAEHSQFCLKKILVPLDFSPASKKAFTYALRFAQQFGSELTLLHVLEPASSPSFAGLPEAPAFSEKEFSDTETNFRALIAAAGDSDVRWTVRTGLPAHEIIEVAKDADFDLIVIATHGFTGWNGWRR